MSEAGKQTPEPNPARPADSEDALQPEIEKIWELRRNVLLERHPFLIGYLCLAALTIAILITHLTIFALSFLLLFLVSDFLTNDLRRWIPFVPKAVLFALLYLVIIGFVGIGTYKTVPGLAKRLPAIAEQLEAQAKTKFETLADEWGLSDEDWQEARDSLISGVGKTIGETAKKIQTIYRAILYFVFALVVNALLYHNTEKIDRVFSRRPDSLTHYLYRFVAARIKIFYFYFKRVMGGQIIISAINTAISASFIIALRLPHKPALIAAVYVFGLFPVVGNLVSNTIVTIAALFSIGTFGAAVCLGMLVGVHKLEYFLNSKIIGEIVDLPTVVTLTSLIACEVAFGVVSLILAIPLVLSVRHELDHIPGLKAEQRSIYATARNLIEK